MSLLQFDHGAGGRTGPVAPDLFLTSGRERRHGPVESANGDAPRLDLTLGAAITW